MSIQKNKRAQSRKHPANNTRIVALLDSASKLAGADGYSNAAAFLGDDSPLFSSGTFKRSYLSSNIDLLTAAYRESWLAMRIIDLPSEDMTRAWYKISSNVSDEDIDELKKIEAKHNIKQELTNAIRWAKLYGGSIAVMVLKGDDDLEQPLDLDLIMPDSFRGVLVLDRTQSIEPSIELVSDIDDPDFGLPAYYTVDVEYDDVKALRIHHSRVLRFAGRELPWSDTVSESYWGASELEHVWDELQKRNATSANIAQLVFQANITTLKMGDFGEALALGTDEQKTNILAAIEHENRFRTSYGLQLLSADDTIENHQYTFGGLSDIYEKFMMDMAGAAEIPATKLFGRSPEGLNSTGESDLRNYYEMIAQGQERMLRPALEKLIPVMAMSCWGYYPEDLEIVFQPVATTSPTDRADLVAKLADPIFKAFELKLITRSEAIAELKSSGVEYGAWDKLPDPDDVPDDYADDPADADADDPSDDDGALPIDEGAAGTQPMSPPPSRGVPEILQPGS